jgi:hypothetical protein
VSGGETTLADALSDLKDRLEGASQGESTRNAAWQALRAVLHYLDAAGVERRMQAPLIALRAALEDAEAGRDNPITKPSEYDVATSRTNNQKAVRLTIAAAAATLLKRAGKPLPSALSEAAKAAGATPGELKQWRKEVSRGTRVWDGHAELYSQALRNRHDLETVESYAARLLRSICPK